jgi:hypothetical protein
MSSFSDIYGKNYLACALIVGAHVYQLYKKKKRVYAKKILDELVEKHNWDLTEKGKELLINSIKNTMKDVKREEKK